MTTESPVTRETQLNQAPLSSDPSEPAPESPIRVRGWLYDGLTSQARVAWIGKSGQGLLMKWDGRERPLPNGSYRIQERLGSSPRVVELDGARFETEDEEAAAKVFADDWQSGWIHKLESRWLYALSALAIIAGIFAFGHLVLLPAVAEPFAKRVPHSITQKITKEALSFLKKQGTFSESKLSAQAQSPLKRAFARVRREYPALPLKLEILDSRQPPNAFAFPDGTIIFTDGAVTALKGNEEQALAILFHEAGHVAGAHSMSNIIKSSAVSLFLFAVIGVDDVASLPLALVTTSYSRAHETQADDFAAESLVKLGLSPALLADGLEAVTMEKKKETADFFDRLDFLSTHPASHDRARRLRAWGK